MAVNYIVESYGTAVEFVGYLRSMPVEQIETLNRLLVRDLATACSENSLAEAQACRNRLELIRYELELRAEDAPAA